MVVQVDNNISVSAYFETIGDAQALEFVDLTSAVSANFPMIQLRPSIHSVHSTFISNPIP